jgi:hypothetical protein
MAAAQPASANSAAADYFMSRVARSSVPKLLTEDERAWYKDIFGAIKHQEWARVQSMFAAKPDGPLHGSARGILSGPRFAAYRSGHADRLAQQPHRRPNRSPRWR